MPVNALWDNLIDYAGVFPPARLPLPEALDEYEQALTDPEGAILGPCLIRASQLPEMDRSPARLGVVLDVALDDLDRRFPLTQAEARLDTGISMNDPMWKECVLYLESAPDDSSVLDEIALHRASACRVRAKIRTGGVTAAAFPTVEVVARFIERCHRLDIPFKATAGLHHPYRHPSATEDAIEHGFINLLAAVRATVAGSASQAEAALAATDPTEFDAATATWRRVGEGVPDREVRRLFRSFGSCSFAEPTGYLRRLGVLPLQGAR